jgi:adenosylcobyric acid synthase
MPIVQESYEILAAQNDLMILEGAGSPAEINLKDNDIVNLRMARLAGARCVVVGDIDRGGVFASLFGTLALLEPFERDLIDGFVINKFRGDIRLLSDGIGGRLLRVAIIRFPSISNFTDFDPLIAEPSVDARFCRTAEEVATADLVILPGSKQTVADLRWMREAHIDEVVRLQAERGLVVGICGGMQMLGTAIDDPYGVEGGGTQEGLGLLSIRTKMNREKTTREATGKLIVPKLFGEKLLSSAVQGYEIHVGETEYFEDSTPFARIHRTGDSEEFTLDGCTSQHGRVLGTYLHGIFHDDALRHAFLAAARSASGLIPANAGLNWKELRQDEFERLARTVADAVDPKRLLGLVGLAWPCVSTKEARCASKR